MIQRLLFCGVLFGLVLSSLSCSKDDPTSPDPGSANVAQYAGTWTGTTGQSLPVYFHVKPNGEIDSLTIRIRMSFPTFTCLATFDKDSAITVQGNSFVARVKYAGANFVTRVHATLGSSSAADGSYDGYGGSFSIVCGSIISMGTAGTVISKGTWSATKTGP
ncbi:MAG: hypothetical protein FJ215_01080 [Ignavibacteria bacterium]|nr:hypothetical protein [Ignavibacteria bacterium]